MDPHFPNMARDMAGVPPERFQDLLTVFVPRVRRKFLRAGANTLCVRQGGTFEFRVSPHAGFRVVLEMAHSTWEFDHPTLDDPLSLAHTLVALDRVLQGHTATLFFS